MTTNVTNGDRKTGTRDEHYDLVSLLYHALEGAVTYETYIQDAEQTGDNELSQFFRELQEQERNRAERAKQLLTNRLSQSANR